jgi:hypothetical protein
MILYITSVLFYSVPGYKYRSHVISITTGSIPNWQTCGDGNLPVTAGGLD